MKRLLFAFALCAMAVSIVVTAMPQDKIPWCHFPQGPKPLNCATAKFNILSISENAVSQNDKTGNGHYFHACDGPVSLDPELPAPFNTVALGSQCGQGGTCGTATATGSNGQIIVNLVQCSGLQCGTGFGSFGAVPQGTCVCPTNTGLGGFAGGTQGTGEYPPVSGDCGASN